MASFNKIAMVGYLGREPELRYTRQDTAVCKISVATTEKRKDSAGDPKEVTTWFQVTFFGRQAELMPTYLSKGSQVWLEGSLTLNQWTDKDGASHPTLEVTVAPSRVTGTGGADNDTASAGDRKRRDQAAGAGPLCQALVSESDDSHSPSVLRGAGTVSRWFCRPQT